MKYQYCSNITLIMFWADIARFLQYFRNISHSFINIQRNIFELFSQNYGFMWAVVAATVKPFVGCWWCDTCLTNGCRSLADVRCPIWSLVCVCHLWQKRWSGREEDREQVTYDRWYGTNHMRYSRSHGSSDRRYDTLDRRQGIIHTL